MQALTFFILCSILSFTYAKKTLPFPMEKAERGRSFEEECIKETKSAPDSMIHMINGDLPNDSATRKFLECFCIKAGYTDETGHIVVDKFVELLKDSGEDADEFVKALNECNKITNHDKAYQVYQMYECFHNNSPIVFNIPKSRR